MNAKAFDIGAGLAGMHGAFPPAKRQPVIGITANREGLDATLREAYYNQVARAGGTPFIIPPVDSPEALLNTVEHIDGLILSGGADINPLWSGEEPKPRLGRINAERDRAELLLTRIAMDRQLPILGICRGMQTLAVALGGKVEQDIAAAGTLKHGQDADRGEPTHSVETTPGSILHGIYGGKTYVNSFHHQAVSDPGAELKATARAADGTIEGVESARHKPVAAVQWHPEWLGEHGLALFKWLCGEAATHMEAKRLHGRILSIDSHCDTPMLFASGVAFDKRDARAKTDLHKMCEGLMDATTMAAYLPQPGIGESFSSKVPFKVGGPAEYVDTIFDRVEEIAQANAAHLSIARTPADLYEDKRQGRKSIMLAIENGLALEGKLSNVRHFAQRGTVYITLCHNGDNDICDSARGSGMHGGLSKFGAQALALMNDCGILADLSHAAEKSFYDAAAASRVPIVCSHSCCKALCNHPRNLTDQQLRTIAGVGGVAQITLYHGFLSTAGEADITHFIAHLEHAIATAGIDHVGVGTDFDGDGGVPGFNDSSEALNFTMHLVRKRYSETDIRKIWGGNWLRAVSKAQAAKNNTRI